MGEGPDGSGQPHHAAVYIAELTADLARIARQNRLDMLCYLLEMARLEAQSAAGVAAPGPTKDLS